MKQILIQHKKDRNQYLIPELMWRVMDKFQNIRFNPNDLLSDKTLGRYIQGKELTEEELQLDAIKALKEMSQKYETEFKTSVEEVFVHEALYGIVNHSRPTKRIAFLLGIVLYEEVTYQQETT